MDINEAMTKCQMCFYEHGNPRRVIIHMLHRHRHERCITVKCVVNDCMYQGKTWLAYKQHCKRKHSFLLNNGTVVHGINQDYATSDNDNDGDDDADGNENYHYSSTSQLLRVAKYVLNLECEYKVSQVAINDIIFNTECILNEQTAQLLSLILEIPGLNQYAVDIRRKLSEHTDNLCFDEIRTQHRRRAFYIRNFHVVPPERCLLGTKYIKAKQGQNKLVKKCGYFVPLKKLLDKLLLLPQVAKHISESHVSQSEIMKDVCDGTYLKNHNLVQQGDVFLQFCLYLDDIELQNPLRAQKTHKLTMFYFSLLNIPPQYRSNLNNIYLLGIGRSRDLREFGMDKLLFDFLSTVKQLKNEGVQFTLNNRIQKIRGDLVMVVGDHPSLSDISGFKQSAFALRFCRMCMCTNDAIGAEFKASRLQLRKHGEYLQQCDTIQDPNLRQRRPFWSKMYGINRKSVLCEMLNFPVTTNVLQDPMHNLLEGVFAHEIALIIHRLVFELDVISLDSINSKLQGFQYIGPDAGNTPAIIEKSHVTAPRFFMKQKSAVVLSMAYLLPLMLGELITERDPQYRNFLACCKIVVACHSPHCDETTAGQLEQLIFQYATTYKRLHPDIPVRPKIHFMTHLPAQFLSHGPAKNHSSIRFESKHFFFKDFRWKNFVNLPLSLSEKHQLNLANKMWNAYGQASQNFVHGEHIIKPGRSVQAHELERAVLHKLPDYLNGVLVLYKTEEVQLANVHFSRGLGLLVSEDDFSGPTFGCIRYILCHDEMYFIVMELMQTLGYIARYNAYRVTDTMNICVTEVSELKCKWPLPVHVSSSGERLITNRCSVDVKPY